MSDARHAALQMLKVEICRAVRARWTALAVLHDDDREAMAATLILALVEVMLELMATGCRDAGELQGKQAMLGTLVAGYAHGPGELEELLTWARRTAGLA